MKLVHMVILFRCYIGQSSNKFPRFSLLFRHYTELKRLASINLAGLVELPRKKYKSYNSTANHCDLFHIAGFPYPLGES